MHLLWIPTSNRSFYREAWRPVINFLSATVLTRPDISGNINPSPQKRISFEPTTTYLLKDLKPFTTYTFRLAARSKHGVGAYSNEISAETPQTRRSPSLSDTFNYCVENTFSNAFRVLNGCSRIRKEGVGGGGKSERRRSKLDFLYLSEFMHLKRCKHPSE